MSSTLQDIAYFGTAWQLLQKTTAQAPITLGGGYQAPTVIRTSDGEFFAGIIEKRDAAGHVTDVILAFAGANGPLDYAYGEAILLGLPSPQADEAAALFDQLMADPRYAEAKIHVTGHSLGAGYTQYILGHALSTYGAAVTDERANFTQFGAPGWGQSIADHFGLALADFDGRITGYTAQNDPVLLDGVSQMGVSILLESYHPTLGLALPAVDGVAAHTPYVYVQAVGFPSWLTPAQQAAAMDELQTTAILPRQMDYGTTDIVSLTMVGDGAANRLTGSADKDVLIGRGGADVLTGGAAADLFVFEHAGDSQAGQVDRIVDFSLSGGDLIDLRQISAEVGTLSFVGSAAFTGANQVRTWIHGGDTWVAGTFGDGATPTFLLKLDGQLHLTAGDFLLNQGLFQPEVHTGYFLY